MMNKFFENTTKKVTLLSIILAVLLVAAIVIGAIFGFNKYTTVNDTNTLTVNMSNYIYKTEKETVDSKCKEAFGRLEVLQTKEAVMGGQYEIVYVFSGDADLTQAAATLQEFFNEKTAAGGAWESSIVNVSVGNERVQVSEAEGYILRGVIAGVVFAVLAFVYVGLRYRWNMGCLAGISVLLGMALTTALIVLTRVPVANSTMYAIAGSGLLTAILLLFTLNKLCPLTKEKRTEENATVIASAIAGKEVLWTAIMLCFAIVLVGALGGSAAAWFAVNVLVGLLAACFVAVLFAPALYLPFMNAADKKAAENATYKGAKKGEKKKPVQEEMEEETEE